MQEVFEKIIEKLEEELKLADKEKERCIKENHLQFDYAKGYSNGVANAIEIVKQEAEQYNNGWIPCNERMPEERESMFAKLKGTEKWKDNMFEKISDEVNVTIEKEDGKRLTMHAHTVDG